jgi:hypothetical protein
MEIDIMNSIYIFGIITMAFKRKVFAVLKHKVSKIEKISVKRKTYDASFSSIY